ncbi:MAG: DUF885 domain-containing protein [Candidatus Obscuribacterales bacterium]|nr:DUF885 domain-containing protein [Candidatus Obscuribacterales bacterium]
MRKSRRLVAGILFAGIYLAAPFTVAAQTESKVFNSQKESTFTSLVDSYFDFVFKTNPGLASQLGFHEYDSQMPDYSETAIQKQTVELHKRLAQFEAVPSASLSEQSRIDLTLIKSSIKSALLELEEIQDWRKNPDFYSSSASGCIYNLMTRDYGPLKQRLEAVIARERKISALLESGKQNIDKAAKIYTEIALEQLPGIIDFFANSVPQKFAPVKDESLQAEFKQVNDSVINELKQYEQHLKNNVLPKASDSFALGKERYSKKLLYDEMVDTPLSELLTAGIKELKRLQAEFNSTALSLEPNKKPLETFAAISADHPSPQKLIADTDGVLDQLKDFCLKKHIVSLPSQEILSVAETPPFMRALAFAAMDCPGPFETKAKEAYYYVTLPESSWNAKRTEEHMRSFCRYDLLNTSVHEAYPGHFVQGLWVKKAPSKTTKILGCNSNVEGWAHYCEQMMLEEGLENGNKKLKLVQIHDALLRVCRYICAIKMHTEGMNVQEASDFFVNEGYQERANGDREAKRGTMDPTYLVYTLGKLQILALREEYKKLKGNNFSLEDFHNRFLATGFPPIKLIRLQLIGQTND